MNRPQLTIVGRYTLEHELGRGAMGVVYRGRDLSLDRPVAVKLLEPSSGPVTSEQSERFRREARVAASLRHQNVVTVHELVDDGERLAIVMELVDGQSLEAILAREGRLSPRVAQLFAEQVLQGLAAAHHTGLVHRDIKPANLLVESGGQLKIADFGIAKMPQDSLTAHGVMFGTAGYIAPELLRGHAADQRSDLFAVGCLAYEMVSGRVAFPGDSFAAVAFSTINDDPEFEPRDWSATPGLFAMTRALLRKDPLARPESAQSALLLLSTTDEEPFAAASATFATMESVPPSSREEAPRFSLPHSHPELGRPASWRKLLGAGVALSVISTIAFTLMLLKSNDRARDAGNEARPELGTVGEVKGSRTGTAGEMNRMTSAGSAARPKGTDSVDSKGVTSSHRGSSELLPFANGNRTTKADTAVVSADSIPLLDRTSLRLEVDEEQLLVANSPSSAVAIWRTSSPAVATVDGGRIHAVGRGSARITVEVGAERAAIAVTVVDTASARRSAPVMYSRWQLDSMVTDAVERSDAKALDRALRNGGSARAKSASGVEVLVVAARLGNLGIVHQLFLCGAPVKGPVADDALRAARQGQVTLIVEQLEQAANENGVTRQLCGERK